MIQGYGEPFPAVTGQKEELPINGRVTQRRITTYTNSYSQYRITRQPNIKFSVLCEEVGVPVETCEPCRCGENVLNQDLLVVRKQF